MATKIALFGGTFDPIHNGHLILAMDAVEQLQLDRLIFVPNLISPHKQNGRTAAPAAVRLEMIMAAIEGEPRFAVDTCELERTPPSYAVDTVIEFCERMGPDDELFYLIGADNLRELETWKRIDDLTSLSQFVVFNRGGHEKVDPTVMFPVLRRQLEISATEIRERVAMGRSIRYLVPEPVLKIIGHHKLYREQRH